MAYRSSDVPSHEDPALREARMELWLIEGLLATESAKAEHGKWWLLGFAVTIGLSLVGLEWAGASVFVILASLGWWHDRHGRALRRQARARGMSPSRISFIFNTGENHQYESLLEPARTRVMWHTWRSGQPTTMGTCVELAERLRGQARLDPLQRWFVEQMEPYRSESALTTG
ncbi:MAG: hypothetical protein H6712_30640 [Myxococcales bacterium]|nr:hypothetical protein [Myxococcales bacterium]